MEQKRGPGRIPSVAGETKATSVVYTVANYRWLVRQAVREHTAPSVIVNRALERERKEAQG